MMIITTEQVKQMGKTGITYVDDKGDEHFIDFEACYHLNVKRKLSPEYIKKLRKLNTDFDEAHHTRIVKGIKEIGQRNVTGESFSSDKLDIGLPYFHFYSDPQTLLKFADEEEYREYIYIIGSETDWFLTDIS